MIQGVWWSGRRDCGYFEGDATGAVGAVSGDSDHGDWEEVGAEDFCSGVVCGGGERALSVAGVGIGDAVV